ncbi:MAG: hypothetical protein MUC36_09080 [Planctomycetes bacterium]|jgi:hypothetical protein|nr:hypothetical protein [Planctomycetota bacterium]
MDPATEAFLSYRRTGDLDALGRTFDLVAPRLLALALHLCGSAHDAEDALQATFVIAMQKHAAFDARQPVGPWLAGILAGEARNLLRRERRRRGEPLPADDANGGAPAVEADPTAVAGQREHGVGAAAGTLSFERAFHGTTSGRFELRRTGTEPSPWVIPVPAECVPNASLRGRVVDPRGLPVAEAVVSVDDEPPSSLGEATFAAAGLDAGPHQLHIAAPGHVVLRRPVELSAGQQLDLGDVALTTGCELRLRFLRPDGSPWRERAPIPQLFNSVGESIYDRVIEADADGTVVMRGLPAGRCRVERVGQDELLFEAFDVELRPEAATECTVTTSLGRHCHLVLGDPEAIPEDVPLEFLVLRADGVVLWSQNVQRKGARLLPQKVGLGDPFRCTLPLEALRAELRGPAGISHGLEFAVRVEQESPVRLVVPQRR